MDRASLSVASGNFNGVLNTLAALTTADQQQALDQLGGNINSNLQTGATNDLRAVTGSITKHLASVAADGSDITLAGDFGTSGEVKVADASSLYWGPDRSQLSDYTVWMQGFDQSGSLGSDSTALGMSSNLGGVTFGFEWRPDRKDHVGFAFGAAETSASIDTIGQTSSQMSYVGGVYGSHDWNRLAVDGSALVGYNHATTKRDIPVVAEEATGTTAGYGTSLDAGLSYQWDLKDNVAVTPRAGLNYIYNHEHGFSETGAPGVNLAISGSDQNLLETSLGFSVAGKFLAPDANGVLDVFRPELSLAWEHDVLNPTATVGEAFDGIASSDFESKTANPGRDAADIGLGLSVSPGDMKTFALYARYDGRISANATETAVTIGGKYSW